MRGLVCILALLTAWPALAVDPIFSEPLAETVFLKTEIGKQIVRNVIRDARGAPERIDASHFRVFRVRLDWEQNTQLAIALEDHLKNIRDAIETERGEKGAPTTSSGRDREAKRIAELAAQELSSPNLMDLAQIAPDSPLRSVSRAARAEAFNMASEGLEGVPQATRSVRRSAMGPKSMAARPRSAAAGLERAFTPQIVPESALATETAESVTADVPVADPAEMEALVPKILPPEAGTVDLYPANIRAQRGFAARSRLIRDYIGLWTTALRMQLRDRNRPWSLEAGSSPEVSARNREYYFNFRRAVQSLGGFDGYSRDKFVYELFSHVKRPAFAILMESTQELLRQHARREISLKRLIEEMKKVAAEKGLDLPGITWTAIERILYTIDRLTTLCGTFVNDEFVPGQIADLARNLKHDQERLAQIEKDLEELKDKTDPLSRERLVARRLQYKLWADQVAKQLERQDRLYIEVVHLVPRVALFNTFREGKMAGGTAVEVYVGAIDMPDAMNVPERLYKIWQEYERYGLDYIRNVPGVVGELPNIAGRLIPLLISDLRQTLRDRYLKENKEFYTNLGVLCEEATGQPLKKTRSMEDLAAYVDKVNRHVVTAQRVTTWSIAGTTAVVWLHDRIFSFMGVCHDALQPVLKYIGF